MSIVMSVIFRGKLPDRKTLSRTMSELGFPFTIAACVGSLERQSGFMPMWLHREDTGVEFYGRDDRTDVAEVRAEIAEMEELAGQAVDPTFDRVADFRWSSDEREMLAGMCAAAALAKLVNGVVFEDQEGRLLSVDEAIAYARQHVPSVLSWYESGRRGTRPADIKHYLKPLLKLRSDLVVIGRYLLIRPVRHVLRGVYLSRTNDKCKFQIVPLLKPLCASNAGGLGYRDSIHDRIWRVWKPHFEPMLMDSLAHDVFESLGKITTLDDLGTELVSDASHVHSMGVTALVLAGERERAAAYVRENEERDASSSDRARSWAEAQKRFLARDINDICAEAHATEAKTAKALKLQGIWEPSPFPVEVPFDERQARTAESLFVPQPWISRPPSLLEDLPDEPGNIRFSKDWLWRNGEKRLVAALSREQAEEAHQYGESYLLATRLLDGSLLLLDRQGRDRDDPDRVAYPRPNPGDHAGDLVVTLEGSSSVTRAEFDKDYDAAGMLKFTSVDIRDRTTRELIWQWRVYRYSNEKSVRDHRSGTKVRKDEPMTDADWDQLRIPRPGFDEFDVLVQMVLSLLRSEGYGEIA